MMELIYTYLKSEDRNIDLGLNFSNEYTCVYDEENGLRINDNKHKYITNYFGQNITNMNLVIGNNASGKTSFLDLIGLTYLERTTQFKNDIWFNLYHEKDEYYIIESRDYDKIHNLPSVASGDSRNCLLRFKRIDNVLCFDSFYIMSNKYKVLYLPLPKISLIRGIKYSNKVTQMLDSEQMFSFDRDRLEFTIQHLHKFLLSNVVNFVGLDLKLNCILKLQEVEDEGIMLSEHNYERQFPKAFNYCNKMNLNLTKQKQFILFYLENFAAKLDSMHLKANKVGYGDDFTNPNLDIFDGNYNYDNIIDFLLEFIEAMFLSFYNDVQIEFNIKLLEELICYIEKVDECYFKGIECIDTLEIPVANAQFISIYNKIEEQISNLLRYEINLEDIVNDSIKFYISNKSDGEVSLIGLCASIFSLIEKDECEDILIVLDEPDRTLHPEWQRKLVKSLVELTNAINKQRNVNIQYIISTHSPILISDFPHNNIIILGRNQENKVEIKKSEFGLLSNIGTVFEKAFFLNAPYGEYAMDKFKEIIESKDSSKIKELENNISNKLLIAYLKMLMEGSDV